MRRLMILLLFSSGCGTIRTVPFEAEEDDGCNSSDCDAESETSSAGGSATSTDGDADCGSSSTDGGDTQFAPTHDLGDTKMCDIWDPEDCPEGEKCTAVATMGSSWDVHECVPIMGDKQWREPCHALGPNPGRDGLDDCGEGLMCWDVAEDNQGYCLEFCKNSANDPWCPEDGVCAIYGSGIAPLCMPLCDPLAMGNDCPNSANLCIGDPGGQGFVCVLDASQGMGTYGTECMYANACNPGLFCAGADDVPGCQGSQGCCSEFCQIGAPNTCTGKDQGQECVPWYEENMAPEGYEHVGGCAIPE